MSCIFHFVSDFFSTSPRIFFFISFWNFCTLAWIFFHFVSDFFFHFVLDFFSTFFLSIYPAKFGLSSRFDEHVSRFRGALVSRPGYRPGALRVDQIDRDARDVVVAHGKSDRRDKDYPAIVHFTTRSSSTTDQRYFKAQKTLENMQHAMESKARDQVTPQEKMRCREQERVVEEMRARLSVKRDVTVVLSARDFYHCGLRSDVAQVCPSS